MWQNLFILLVAHNLTKPYLKGRSQYVKISNIISEPIEIEFVLPQGTVLGPLLFNVYIYVNLSVPIKGMCSALHIWASVTQTSEMAGTKLSRLTGSLLSLNINKTYIFY